MKKQKKILLGVAISIIVIFGIFVALNFYIKNRIQQGLQQEFSSLSYDEISVNILKGNTSISNMVFNEGKFKVEARELRVLNFHYTDYFLDNNIIIGEVEISQPIITLNESDTIENNGRKSKKDINLKLETFRIKGGNFQKIENDTASNSLFVALNLFELKDLTYGSQNNAKPSIDYAQASFETDSIYYNLNPQHFLTVDKVKREGESIAVSKLKMIPKLNRVQFDSNISYEKDRVDLDIDSIYIADFSWETLQKTLLIKSPLLQISKADLFIYRNKLLPDDTRTKPLYSKMLRELGVKIKFDSISIRDSKIVYEEKIKPDRPPAKIHLDNMKITINNLTNLLSDSLDVKKTTVKAEGDFMDDALITFTYEFEVQNQQDEFDIMGKLAGIPASAVNPFLRPAMGIEVEGTIESVFFNFRGNNYQASGDMQLAYKNFKVHILEDGEREKKSLLSGIANLFIKNNVINEKVSEKHVSVERDQTKSFWNFLWLLIKKGTMKTLI